MRFTQAAILALATIVSADNVNSLVDQFSTIQSTDTAAFTLWRGKFDDAYKSYVVSFYNQHGSEIGYGPSAVSSIESSLLSDIDKDSTQGYSFFYSQFYGSDNIIDYATGTEAEWIETASWETEAYETGETLAFYITDSAELNSYLNATDPYAFYTLVIAERNGTHHANHSGPITSAYASQSPQTASPASLLSAPLASSTYTVATVSSFGMGARQAPMIVGAALAGLSVLFL